MNVKENRKRAREWYWANRKDVLARRKARRRISQDRQLQRLYGISREAQLALWRKQEKRCALCRKLLVKHGIHTDHDHRTGNVRGLLHRHCNSMLGHVEKWGIKRVLKYLNRRK